MRRLGSAAALGMVALTAIPRSVTDQAGSLGAFGVDTVAYRFRPGWSQFMDRLLRAPHRFAGGAHVMLEKPGGIVVAVFQGAIRVEGRLDPLMTGERESWRLRPADDLAAGERRARELVEGLAGAPMDGGRQFFNDGELARVDATHEVEFDDQADGLAFLRAVASMRPSARKVDAVFGVDGQPQTVYFRTPKRFAVRERIYDKGVESGSHPAGLRVRIEAQRRFPKNRAIHHGSLDPERRTTLSIASRVSSRYLVESTDAPLRPRWCSIIVLSPRPEWRCSTPGRAGARAVRGLEGTRFGEQSGSRFPSRCC